MTDFWQKLSNEFTLPLQDPILVFSLILFIILLSPIILRRFNIPGIIGLIISGVIIGPYGLNILENNSAIDLFSTIGLLYIMFIAGLELDIAEFKANRNKSILFGFFTFTIPLGVGFPVCYHLLGYDFNASLLTASMFATHTLVAYPIVSKLGISKNQAVAVTVGGTILTDTAVLISLAVIVGGAQGTIDSKFWLRLGISLAIFTAIMFFIIPRLAKWFFRKLESEKHSHYIFVLAVVFFAAFLAEVAGLEPIIGAFAAGLALNKLIPSSSSLMNRIEYVGNSLFIPFFLISVGMIVDVSVILNGPMALVIAGTLSVVAIFGKWLAALITQLAFKYSKAQRQLIFGLSSSHAAATLAVILVGYEAGIIDDNILNGTIILILITCVVATFVTGKAAKKIVLETENSDTDIEKSIGIHKEHILLPVEKFDNIGTLLEFAILIKNKKSENPISILSVVSNDTEAGIKIMKTREKLEEFVKQAAASETKVDIITTIDYNPISGMSRIAREILADIIVLDWPDRTNFFERLLGEKIDSIISNTDKTLFICHFEKPLVSHKRMVVAAPPFSEHENGFNIWITKTLLLAKELSIPVKLICNESTEKAIDKIIKKAKLSVKTNMSLFSDWEDFLVISRKIDKDDLIILVSARRGAPSHIGVLDRMPSRLEKYFANNNRVIIYPQHINIYRTLEHYKGISSEPLHKGIKAARKIRRGIGSVLKRN